MLINPKIFAQQNNIYENKKHKVALPYSNELIFYKILDQALESGKTIIITFPNEKMEEGSELHKRVASCANGKEFFDKLAELGEIALEALLHITNKNIFGMWKIMGDLNQKQLYSAYQVDFCYDENKHEYFLSLIPIGDGNDSKAWMFLA